MLGVVNEYTDPPVDGEGGSEFLFLPNKRSKNPGLGVVVVVTPRTAPTTRPIIPEPESPLALGAGVVGRAFPRIPRPTTCPTIPSPRTFRNAYLEKKI